MEFVNFGFKELYPSDYEDKVKQVKEDLYHLFNAYTNNMVAANTFLASSSRNTHFHSSSGQPLNKTTFMKASFSNITLLQFSIYS